MPIKRVENFLNQYPDLKVILFDSSTHTSQMAAETLGVEVGQIAKTLVFTADGQGVIIVTCGDKKVDTKRLSKILGVRKVRFADAETVRELTGFLPGGVSPIGLLSDIPLYLDKSLFCYDLVYAAAGTANSSLPISPQRLALITHGNVIDVC
ncbi:YbaK/EbsC family protein [Dendrosporobacter sp. 1207_IL3150]|uniref:YbaK/EbsC family protein n=1 Tax=Dendrosporobacter sp. 1207_IL3150 TaxID=3084054 RepID=UPI002FD94831